MKLFIEGKWFVTIVLFLLGIFAIFAIYFSFNIEKYWYPGLFSVSPKHEAVFSYGVYQGIYAKVTSIDETTVNGAEVIKITMIPVDSSYKGAPIYNFFDKKSGELEALAKIIWYWDDSTEKLYKYEERPVNLDSTIRKGDNVTVSAEKVIEKGELKTTYHIKILDKFTK